MASKKFFPKAKSKLHATPVTDKREPCAFCQREVDDEATYGKLYAIGDIQVHYFCALLSCCLVQKGKDTEGLFGFLYHDIVAEVERSKKHKCSYCNTGGAALGCSVSQCRKQFHLPCGREKNAVSLFYGNYKSFCQQHAPRQKIPDHIMAQARLRMKKAKNVLKAPPSLTGLKELCADNNSNEPPSEQPAACVCVICYERVEGFPCARTFWPPCCARDAWFHRSCLQRMALSAGIHYLKCPLCNDKEQFYDAVVGQGFYVPDRDAAWELEQDAFAEIYERPSTCSAEECQCPMGRSHDAESGDWDIQLCLLCGALGCHARCARGRYVCHVCQQCAPGDVAGLAARVEAVIQLEQRQSRESARRPVMTSRMSLRRTKARIAYDTPSTSQNNSQTNIVDSNHQDSTSVTSARVGLNLRTPRLPLQPTEQFGTVLTTIENTMFSPTKLVEDGLKKIGGMAVKNVNSDNVITTVKEKLRKPRPLSVKKKIVDIVLNKLLEDIMKEKRELKKWRSPRKTSDGAKEESPETTTLEEGIQETKELNKSPQSEDLSRTEDVVDHDRSIEGDTEKDVNGIQGDKDVEEEDESSNSTFQLPSEFIAEHNSDDSLPFIETPMKLTTVDIEKDSSLEISENNEVVNISVVKIEQNCQNKEFVKNLNLKTPMKTDKCAFKFDLKDKEALVEDKVDMDVESFKNFYLNEVDREFQCIFNHKHGKKDNGNKVKLRTAIDFALDATKNKEEKRKKLKRKLISKDVVVKKKSKNGKEIVLHYDEDTPNDIKVVCTNNSENVTESIDLTVETPEKKKNIKKRFKKTKKRRGANEREADTINLIVATTKNKKRLKKRSRAKKRREKIQLKIRFRKERVRLEITKSQTKNKKLKIKKQKDRHKKLKQCILQYDANVPSHHVIVKPADDVTPKKRNYVKLEKSPDALVQTSIHSFFKKIPAQPSKN